MRFWDNCSTFADEMDILNLIKSSGARNFAKLLSANVLAQVIGLIVYPILTRIYSPEDFGLLNLFLSIGGVLAILSTAEYYYAIVLPKEEQEAENVFGVGVLWLIATTLLIGISITFAKPISLLFKSPNLASHYWLMPLYVFAIGAWNLLNYWYIRQKQFGQISQYLMSQSILSAGGKIGMGYAGILQGGMIYAVVIAPLLSIGTSIVRNGRGCLQPLLHISKADMLEQSKQYRNFPCFVLPRSFLNVLAGQLPILLLTPFFGAKYVGLLSMALLLGYTPIGTITRAIYQVLYQHTTERVHAKERIGGVFWRFIAGSSAVVLPLFGGLFFVLPDMTSWLLGEEWRVVGTYIRWMLPWLYLSLLTGSTCYLSDVFMKQRIGLFFEILLAVCRVSGLCIGIAAKDFTTAIAAYSMSTAIAVLAQLIWLASLVRKYDRGITAA